jgi:hypothetical protein
MATAQQLWQRIMEHDRLTRERAMEREDMVREWKRVFEEERRVA